MDEYPYSAIGIVLVTNKENNTAFHSTGCLIGFNLVLTRCNSLWRPSKMEIEFVPAPIYKRGGKGLKVGQKYLSQQASQIYRETGFYKGGDFAVLELESELNLEEYFGSFGYNFNPREYKLTSVEDNMYVFGYPPNR